MIEAGELLEHATVFEHHYGTPAKPVEQALQNGMDVLFDIDWQGTRQLAKQRREDLVSVFILPPSMAELERRLRQRGQDSEATIRSRMSKAKSEISHWREYDYVVVNTDLDLALSKIIHIIEAERLKRMRQTQLGAFIDHLCSEV